MDISVSAEPLKSGVNLLNRSLKSTNVTQKIKRRIYIVTLHESRWIKAQNKEEAISKFNRNLGDVTTRELEVEDLGED